MQLKLLWELQEIDLAIIHIRSAIEAAPGKSGVDETEESLNIFIQERDSGENHLKAERKALKDMELQVQQIADKRKELSETMYSGKGAAKELEQMLRRMDSLAEDKSKLEDNILSLMESVEEHESELNGLIGKVDEIEKELREKRTELESELAAYELELKDLEEKRSLKASEIESQLIDRYTRLAAKHQGKALARLDNDICGACKVFISSALRGKLYNPGAMVYCENCGRLLVKLEDMPVNEL